MYITDCDSSALVANKLRHAGQTCISAQRAFVHESVVDQVASLITVKLAKLKLGHGADDQTTLGPLQTERSRHKALEHVQDAKSKGAVCHVAPIAVPSAGFFFAPTLLTNCTKDMLVFQEESFAPIISIASFRTEQEVCEQTCPSATTSTDTRTPGS